MKKANDVYKILKYMIAASDYNDRHNALSDELAARLEDLIEDIETYEDECFMAEVKA